MAGVLHAGHGGPLTGPRPPASAVYDDEAGTWTVEIDRDGEKMTLHPSELVLATGMSGKANVPTFTGQDIFQGESTIRVSIPVPTATKGKKVVVVGSNNSAMDISKALVDNGIDVTMIQRSSTHIVKSDSLMEIALGDLYSQRAVDSGMTTKKADFVRLTAVPHHARVPDPVYDAIREQDKEFWRRLAAAGFDLDFGDDDSGLFAEAPATRIGYYIDVGAAELIADSSIKLAHGNVDLTENSVVLDDGSRTARRRRRLRHRIRLDERLGADLMGQQIADKVGKVWSGLSDTTKDPGPWEGGAAQYGSRPSNPHLGSAAATCTSRVTTRHIWRCSSRRVMRAS